MTTPSNHEFRDELECSKNDSVRKYTRIRKSDSSDIYSIVVFEKLAADSEVWILSSSKMLKGENVFHARWVNKIRKELNGDNKPKRKLIPQLTIIENGQTMKSARYDR